MNNLTDLTLDRRYSSICGYTERDLDTVFAPQLAGLDRERVREWYNGYRWRGEEKVYNPYDVLLLFDLDDGLELDDTTGSVFRESLLYFVSNSFEDEIGEPILGMQKFMPLLDRVPGPTCRIEVSAGADAKTKTASTTHGGFDNDPLTMNHILRTIPGRRRARPFTEGDLGY